jgi:hypothetical protein
MIKPLEVKEVMQEANDLYMKVRGYPIQSFQIEAIAIALVNQVNERLRELDNIIQSNINNKGKGE